MFRRRLSLVLIFLAATIALQGAAAVIALRETERQVIRGRIATDIHLGFLQLATAKQRLRSWLTQHMIGAGGDVAERDALLHSMRRTLGELTRLTQVAASVQRGASGAEDQLARLDALRVLGKHVGLLSTSMAQLNALPADALAKQGWDTLEEVFERSEGRDLRELIAQNIERETALVQRERDAADQALARMRLLWTAMALTLAFLALASTVYFGRALRRPLDALFEGAQALRQGQLQHRVALAGSDEFADVARSMNAMAEELEQHRTREEAQRHVLEVQVQERTRALHEANESLRQTDLRRRQLLADISHELRTPTTAIHGEAEIALRGKSRPSSDYRDALQRIVDTSRQLAAVIEDLLDMARSDMESLSLVRQPLDLRGPLAEALTQVRALAEQHQVQLECGPECALSAKLAWPVLGDAQRLTQLLLLLLNNAVAYSHPHGRVQVSLQRAADDAQVLEVHVVDAGIGIPSAELALVFERHFRGSLARVHRAAGSGLGLPIARALAQGHGGSLHLVSPAQPAGAGAQDDQGDHGGQGDQPGTRAVLRLPLLNA